jgi:hypothetical protein
MIRLFDFGNRIFPKQVTCFFFFFMMKHQAHKDFHRKPSNMLGPLRRMDLLERVTLLLSSVATTDMTVTLAEESIIRVVQDTFEFDNN